ncbi:MAG TPA: MATE family efflux transporter [Thermohalobaculum sp.]|nr:MATE family efflux transporter [Thermohalobaculum sp.]
MNETARTPLIEQLAPRIWRHFADLLRLAWPVMLSRAGILVMAFCDIAMLGRYGAGAIGEINLGVSIFVPLLVVTIGLTSGMVPVVAYAFGAGAWAECGNAWRRAISLSLVTSTIAALICWQGEALLAAFGQTAEMSARGGAVTRALAPGLIAQTIYTACAFYLEATRRPLPALVAMIFANLGNFSLNWLLIWGHWGFPELGAVGAALASTIVRFGAAAGMILYIVTRPRARAAGVVGPWQTFWGPGGWAAGRTMRKLGASAGLSNGFETIGFAAMTMFAGQLGTLPLDAYSLSHNLLSTLFMVGLGLAVASGVRVGIEMGRDRPDEAAFAGWVGLLAVVVVMSTLAVLVVINRESLAAIYTNDPVIAARASGLFVLSALVFVPDSAQVVMGQALRSMGDAWVAVACYIASFVMLMVPLGWLLVNPLGYDERALIGTIIAACLLASALLTLRFHWLTRHRGRDREPRP